MKRSIACICMLVLFSFGAMAAALNNAAPTTKSEKSTTKSHSNTSTHAGEQVFMANCARCHTPPMSIPQRVTGTVILHMQARARLSRQDEQALLKYMAP